MTTSFMLPIIEEDMNTEKPTAQITEIQILAAEVNYIKTYVDDVVEVQGDVIDEVKEEPTYSDDDLFCLAASIYQEVGGGENCTDDEMLYSGGVVVNRVESELFPNTIREVLEQYKQFGVFYWTGVKFIDRGDNELEQAAINRCYEIAERILNGERIVPSNVIYASEFKNLGSGTWKKINGIYYNYE